MALGVAGAGVTRGIEQARGSAAAAEPGAPRRKKRCQVTSPPGVRGPTQPTPILR